jgi:hypothetical protein
MRAPLELGRRPHPLLCDDAAARARAHHHAVPMDQQGNYVTQEMMGQLKPA